MERKTFKEWDEIYQLNIFGFFSKENRELTKADYEALYGIAVKIVERDIKGLPNFDTDH